MKGAGNTIATFLLLIASPSTWAGPVNNQTKTSTKINRQMVDTSPYHLDWSLEIFGRGVSDSYEESRVTGVNALGTFDYNIDFIQAKIAAGILVESGSYHSLFDNNRPVNSVYLDEGFLLLRAGKFFNVRAGALNQRTLDQKLLLDEQAFPAVQEQITYSNRRFAMSLSAQQAIPTSYSLSTMTSDKEPLPSFNTEQVDMSIRANKYLEFKASVGHYAFHNLPSQVAFDSQLGGNQINGAEIPQLAEFANEFDGVYGSGQIKIYGSRSFKIIAGASYIENFKAPSKDEDSGYISFIEVNKSIKSGWSISPRFEFFVNERETSPSFYNADSYGNNNRQGYVGEVKIQNRAKGFSIKARYVDSRLLQLDPLQDDSQLFMLSAEIRDGV